MFIWNYDPHDRSFTELYLRYACDRIADCHMPCQREFSFGHWTLTKQPRQKRRKERVERFHNSLGPRAWDKNQGPCQCNIHPMRLVLASASPRRAQLLQAAGFEIEVIPGRIDEQRQVDEPPDDYVLRLAEAKAQAVSGQSPDVPIIAADTIVLMDDHLLGKPSDDMDAAAMLRLLSGRIHEVLTGVVVRVGTRQSRHVERTRVRIAPLSGAEIAWYVATGEPRDKAGAYAVQGLASRFIEAIEGSYSNVVGLPVAAVYRLLRDLVGHESFD
jgi:nucleoside triphosphate pyrophosphatase